MGFLKWMGALGTTLFGSSSNGKGVIGEASDAVDRWYPSDATRHEQSIEDLQAGDASQASARAMVQISHDSWFDILIDGFNRLPRPVITTWAIGGLMGLWPLQHASNLSPVMWNIIWTVVTFWFGSRVIFKDIPRAISLYHGIKAKVETVKKTVESEKKPEKKPDKRNPLDGMEVWDDIED